MQSDLNRLGLGRVLSPPPEGTPIARVTADHGVRYQLGTPSGFAPGVVLPTAHLPERPAVGDWVVTSPHEDGHAILEVLPRRTCLARQGTGLATRKQVIAANVDRVLHVVSMNRDLNVRRIERTLAAIHASGAEAVLVIHKLDLDPTGQRATLARLGAVADGVPVEFTSVALPDGLAPLDRWLEPGHTLALLGSSGVGKSTLVNHLLGEEAQVTQSQRLGDDRGRHTTTTRSLFPLPDGRGVLLDTPGMRELALWSGEGISSTFADVEELMKRCAYRDCRHDGDAGCAVEEALADGTLDVGRWENHNKLLREAAWLERRRTGEDRRQGRAFSKWVRSLKKDSW